MFWYGVKLCRRICFKILHIPWNEFSVKEMKKYHTEVEGGLVESDALAQSCVSKKLSIKMSVNQNVLRISTDSSRRLDIIHLLHFADRFHFNLRNLSPDIKIFRHDTFWWHLVSTRTSQKFCNILVVHMHNSSALNAFAEIGKVMNKSVFWKCQAPLILSECYLRNLPLWLRAQPRNPQFLANLTLSDRRDSCNSWNFLSHLFTVCTVINCAFTFQRTTNVFAYLYGVIVLFEAMHNVTAYQLAGYYQLQLLPSMAWTASVTWYTRRKVAFT